MSDNKANKKTANVDYDAKRRARRRAREFEDQWLFGIHACQSVLEHNPQRAIELILQKDLDNPRFAGLQELAAVHGTAVQYWSADKMHKRVQDHDRHQGVLLRAKPIKKRDEQALQAAMQNLAPDVANIFVLLDGVTDPQNLGGILRNADAFGVRGVILPEESSAWLSPAVHKVAVGAADTVDVYYLKKTNRAMRLASGEGLSVIATALAEGAKPLSELQLSNNNILLVLGAEGVGLKASALELADEVVYLPMQGWVDSLNVSTACAVFLAAIKAL